MQEIKLKAAALWGRLDKTQLLRHGVQLISFLLFPGLFLTVFHALRDVVMALVNGTFAFASASGSLATLVVTLGVTALWGRFFCGYLCTFGALQELLAGYAGTALFVRHTASFVGAENRLLPSALRSALIFQAYIPYQYPH